MNTFYQKARFLCSVHNLKQAPPDAGVEVAFAGRSNAGKSSAINTITSHKSLARTSKTPGRTQQLVFFEIDSNRRFVDLPGYGYAKVPARVQQQWHRSVNQYFQSRKSLQGIFLIMDVRRPMTPIDLQMIDWATHCGIALHVILTKADKLKRGAQKSALLSVTQQFETNQTAVTTQLFSSLKRSGVDEAHRILDTWFGIAPDPRTAAPVDL